MISFAFLALFVFSVLSIKPLLHPRQVYYQTFYLNPDVDWTKPEVQEAWNRHGVLVGKFLSEETPLALVELLVLCNAYIMQHGNPYKQPFSYSILDYELQILFESSIVIVTEWKAFPTSPTRVHSPLRIPSSPHRQSTYTSLFDEQANHLDE